MIDIHFACYDHRNGVPRGRVSGIEFGDFLTFDHVSGNEPPIAFFPDRVRIFRIYWPIVAHEAQAATWCWDAVRTEDVAALSLLRAIRLDGRFILTGGDSEASDAYEAGTIDCEIIRRCARCQPIWCDAAKRRTAASSRTISRTRSRYLLIG